MQGDIAANEIITVTPMKDTIELNQSGKTSKSATVALDANELDSAAISGAAGKDVSGTVIASGLTAGSWSGTAGFSVNVVEKYGEDITINDPSTYGIPTSGDVTIPSVATDSNGVKHRVTSNGFHAFLNCTGLTSITIRIPSRSDSSFTYEIPSIFLSLTKDAIFSINSFLFTL